MANEELMTRLKEAGIDTEEALSRMMGNETLFIRILSKLCEDTNYDDLMKGLSSGDLEGAFRAAHTLKGIYGNVSATELFRLFSEQTELLRAGDMEGAKELMTRIAPAHDRLFSILERS